MKKRETSPTGLSAALLPSLVLSLLMFILAAGFVLFSPPPGWAESNAAPTTVEDQQPAALKPIQMKETTSLMTAIFKVAGSLILVVGLMLITAAWIRKLGFTGGRLRSNSLISILDTRMIAPKKYVAVLEVANEFVLVGITDQQINLLTKLEPNEQLTIQNTETTTPASSSPFASMFHKAVNGFGKGNREG